jgi:hypothetical protein
LYLTAQEAEEVGAGIDRLISPFKTRWDDPSQRPAGSLPYEVLAFGYPLTDPPHDTARPDGAAAPAGPRPAGPTPRRD